MSYRALATLCLIATFALSAACGSSERRGAPTGYNGPTQVEGEDPDHGGSSGFVATFTVFLSADVRNENSLNALYCECSFETMGYDSAEQCIQDNTDDPDGQQDLIECFTDAASNIPAPPASLQTFANEGLAASNAFDTCIAAIDTSSCSDDPDTVEDALETCEDNRDAVVEGYQPSSEDEAWIDQFESAIEQAGCFSFGPGSGGGQTPPSTGDGPSPDGDL